MIKTMTRASHDAAIWVWRVTALGRSGWPGRSGASAAAPGCRICRACRPVEIILTGHKGAPWLGSPALFELSRSGNRSRGFPSG